MEVHVTQTQSFRSCRRYHRYAYTQGLSRRQKTAGALWLGTGVHSGLAAYYGQDVHPDEEFRRWAKENWPEGDDDRAEEAYDLGVAMLRGYPSFAERADTFWEIEAVEFAVSASLPNGVTLVGTLDLLVRNLESGLLWVVDHKTRSSFSTEEDIELDDQLSSYVWLAQQLTGETIAGAIYNQLRKKIPATPHVLKTGGLSKAKGIDTTPERYLAAIEELELDPSDYSDILESLKGNDFYRRTTTRRDSVTIDRHIEDLTILTTEMTHPVEYINRSSFCSWGCEYADLCRAESTGGDVESLIDALYEKGDEWKPN